MAMCTADVVGQSNLIIKLSISIPVNRVLERKFIVHRFTPGQSG